MIRVNYKELINSVHGTSKKCAIVSLGGHTGCLHLALFGRVIAEKCNEIELYYYEVEFKGRNVGMWTISAMQSVR